MTNNEYNKGYAQAVKDCAEYVRTHTYGSSSEVNSGLSYICKAKPFGKDYAKSSVAMAKALIKNVTTKRQVVCCDKAHTRELRLACARYIHRFMEDRDLVMLERRFVDKQTPHDNLSISVCLMHIIEGTPYITDKDLLRANDEKTLLIASGNHALIDALEGK